MSDTTSWPQKKNEIVPRNVDWSTSSVHIHNSVSETFTSKSWVILFLFFYYFLHHGLQTRLIEINKTFPFPVAALLTNKQTKWRLWYEHISSLWLSLEDDYTGNDTEAVTGVDMTGNFFCKLIRAKNSQRSQSLVVAVLCFVLSQNWLSCFTLYTLQSSW